ncbi:MAG TPA: substrate-binding domain-containing protein [Candidatus Cybelea sp.]|jgi:ribose transport system substrate-binding protein|nr:substrate-binding domain-containing protein [Candidatus Cybelea sp.]
MTTLRFLVSLITKDNDYQMEQAASAKSAAAELGVEAEILYAHDDPITQSTQLLKAIQSEPSLRPNGILVEPVGATSFPQVAKTAAAADLGWAVLNRGAEYAAELQKTARRPVFSVSADQLEVGRIQGRQVAALLPRGGSVLLIQGPSVSSVSRDRLAGLQEVLAPNVHVSNLRGRWTEESAHQSVSSWLRLMAAQKVRIDLIVAQNDAMGMGARKAINEIILDADRDYWAGIPIIGCDGVPRTGQMWVRTGQLAATVIVPPNAGEAIALMTKALRTGEPVPQHAVTASTPFPAIEKLAPRRPADE